MIRPTFGIVLILTSFCLSGKAISQDKAQVGLNENIKKLTVATLVGYPPFIIAKHKLRAAYQEVIPPGVDSDSVMGYSWDVFRGSFHQQGYTIELKVYPWVRAIEEVKKMKVDLLFPASKTKRRSKYLLFSGEAINKVDFLVYVKQDNSLQWQGLRSLKGLRISQMRGWNYGSEWDTLNNVKKVQVSDILQGFKMLDNKRVDGFAGYFPIFDYTLSKANWAAEYRKLPTFDSSYEYVVSAIKNPRAEELVNAFDKGKKALVKSGQLQKAQRTWLYDIPGGTTLK